MAGLPGVVITIGAETRDAINGIKDTNRALGGVGETSGKVAGAIRSSMAPAIGVLGALAGGAMAAANAASDLEQATGAATAVFGPHIGVIEEAAKSANKLGLSTADYNQNAAVMGALLKSTGADAETAAGGTAALIESAADMAAQFGGPTTDAVGALGAMLKGEYDTLDNYGIKMTAADVKARAMADGTSEAEAKLAILNDALAETGTQGAAAREMDTMASKTAEAKAAFTDATAALGDELLPVLADFANYLKDASKWVKDNSKLVQTLAIVIGTLAGAIVVMNVAMTAYTVIQWAANTALWGFPVVWIVAAIAAVIAAVVLLWKNWDSITAFFKKTWDAIVGAFNKSVQAIKGFFDDLWSKVKDVINKIIGLYNKLVDAFNKLPVPDIPHIPGISMAGYGPAAAATVTGRTGRAAGGGVTVVNNFYGPIDSEGAAREIRRTLNASTIRQGLALPMNARTA